MALLVSSNFRQRGGFCNLICCGEHVATGATRMDISELRETTAIKTRTLLTLNRNDLPLTVQYGESTYVLVVTKSEKLLLQKPLI
jgi:hypothetical protein